MAIDTRNKRSSALHIGLPWRGQYPAPDAAIGAPDRLHIALLYSGIAAASPVVVVEYAYFFTDESGPRFDLLDESGPQFDMSDASEPRYDFSDASMSEA